MSLHDACRALIEGWMEQAKTGSAETRAAYALCAITLAAALNAQQPTGPVCADCGREWKTGHMCEVAK